MEVTELDRRDLVGAAERPDEPVDPFDAVREPGSGWRRGRKCHALGAVPAAQVAQPLGYLIERLIPPDAYPTWILATLRIGSLQRRGSGSDH